jgi:hypothetical protein
MSGPATLSPPQADRRDALLTYCRFVRGGLDYPACLAANMAYRTVRPSGRSGLTVHEVARTLYHVAVRHGMGSGAVIGMH